MIRILILLAVAVTVFVFVRSRRSGRVPGVDKAVAPIGSLEADRQTLRALRDAGADLTKPTEVNFYLYFAERRDADSASAQAGTPTLSASVRRGSDDSA